MLRSDTHGSEWSERSERSEFEQVARMGWAMERSGASSAFRIARASGMWRAASKREEDREA